MHVISAVVLFLFFCSGVSGLIYQVIWVREFGNVFGNTVYSTSLVLAIFMLGLGAGSYLAGIWADRRYAAAPHSLLRSYGVAELIIAALGLAVSLALPHLASFSAQLSSYERDASGWFVVSTMSYLARGAIAFVLLSPITLLMGGTLTLLIRHLVRGNVEAIGGWRIALLYGVNTAGAALGAFMTDFALVPAAGSQSTQLVAVALNAVAGVGALVLSRQTFAATPAPQPPSYPTTKLPARVAWTAIALALTGFAAMGLEILWFRHFSVMLGGFRAVFSLLMTIVLAGIGAGAIMGGWLDRRLHRPVHALIAVEALFVAASLLGLAAIDTSTMRAEARMLGASFMAMSPLERTWIELWYNARAILVVAGLPALLMGCSFPLANAIIQRTEAVVGRRAGALYLANTAGAVAGSLATGYFLLPAVGVQQSATVLACAAALSIVPLYLTAVSGSRPTLASTGAAVVAVASLVLWLLLPGEYVVQRSQPQLGEDERRISISEGITEIIAVTEVPGRGRGLITNGHAMSSTARLDQRYMRALTHIPLLSMPAPERVLVIGFGVGNSTHAATLHPSVRRVDVADLSRHVLEHSRFFADANHDVLKDGKVSVYVNDGRQHLQMQAESTYDLITLEPPPISYAGVGALYSREFYELARTRLRPGGYLSQWLPAYQTPAETTLALVRSFLDVFPQAVLLSGEQAELILIGTTAPVIEIDPVRVARALEAAPLVQDDLQRVDLGSVMEIVGTFVGSAETLTRATRHVEGVTDGRPLQEYGVRSVVGAGFGGVPASLFNLSDADAWCPRCFEGEQVARQVADLGTYLALLQHAYNASVPQVAALQATHRDRRILGSSYLGDVVPETADIHLVLASRHLREGSVEEAIGEYREALRLEPENGPAHYALGSALLERRQFPAAAAELRAALGTMESSAGVHNDLGVALASMGALDQALEHFRRAVELDAAFAEAQRNLTAALHLSR